MPAIKSNDDDTQIEDNNLAAVSQVEEGIRDFVRNDIAYLRRAAPSLAPEPQPTQQQTLSAEQAVATVSSLIQRVAGVSLNEIENLIQELESLRDVLHTEGQRVQREIAGYAQLSEAAIKSTRMISENVAQWKRAAEGIRES
jgi:hypothetical protein